ncbi:MAG: hypothetical protein ACPGVG_05640 [Mycobacterium sp.]
MIQRFYGGDPWNLSLWQWRVRLDAMSEIAAREAGETDHARQAEALAKESRINDVRQHYLENVG